MKKITFLLITLLCSGLAFAQPGTFIDLGVIGSPGTYDFSSENSLNTAPIAGNTDTEIGLWDAAGTLLAANDDTTLGGYCCWSAISENLAAGDYYIGIAEWNSVFANGFLNTGSSWESGELSDVVLNINGVQAGTYVDASDALDQETAFFKVTIQAIVGTPPVISCPADVMINTTGGLCTGVPNWTPPLVFDLEDGFLTATQVSGPMSGVALAPGAYVVVYDATDSDGNTVSCSFNVTVADMEAPIAVCQDISVDLDAAGSVTITPADLDNGSSDNCGIVSSTMSVPGSDTIGLEVSFAGGNGQSGNMFDVVVLNPLTINSFDISMDSGLTADAEVYFKTGTWIGSETTPGDWTLVANVPGVVSAGENLPTPLNLSMGINVGAGETVAFYVTLSNSTGINYTNGGSVGDVWASDANLQVLEGAGKSYPFGSTFAPRNFNGNIIYDITGQLPFSGTFDCSHVGENVVTVTHTDAAGNSTTCMSTVTVSDVTAPEIVCIGEQVTGPFSTGASPALPIVDNTTVSTTMTVVDDYVITDLDVNLDITHTWVGDLQITLESPSGTQVLIFDGGADGCSGDNIMDRYDDESANALDCQAASGDAFPLADYIPSNPLAAFDGESTLGDWTIFIEDTAGGDAGTLNTWSLVYDFDPIVAPPFEVILDANGMATVDAASLILNVDESCGWTPIFAGTPPTTSSLTTTFDGGNGQSGNMFDIMAINDLTIDSFDISFDSGVTDDVEIYTKTGTWVGFDADPAAWTLLTTVTGVTSAGDNVPTPLNLNLGVDVLAGETVAFYVTLTTTTAINYTNGTVTGALFASDDNLEFYEGAGNPYPFAGTFEPRIFNGNIVYSTGSGPSTTLDLDCSMLGENLIEVTVVDDSGNMATCTSTIIVSDETAPILVCTDATIELGPDGTAVVDPLALLGTTPSTFTVLVIGSDNQSNTEGFTDITVPVTDAVSVSFDWEYVLNDVPGFDSFGYLLNGAYTPLTDPTIGNQSGSETIALAAGDIFGFRSQTDDNVFGNNETVISNFLPGFTGQFAPANWTETLTNSDGSATFVEIPGGPLSFDACGITDYAVNITEVNCDDIGTPVIITVFAADSSGNSTTCTATVTVIDAIAPTIICPADQTVDPGPGNLFYAVPDYFATGEASADDNCTDPVTITTQDPAAGSLITDGTYTVTITGEDASGNVGTCTFELTVESVLGVESNELNNAISMYPNPAQDRVTVSNSSNIQLETAVIYDLNGKMVNQIDLSTMQGEQVIDISELASGVYVVQLTSDTSSAIKRLIKE